MAALWGTTFKWSLRSVELYHCPRIPAGVLKSWRCVSTPGGWFFFVIVVPFVQMCCGNEMSMEYQIIIILLTIINHWSTMEYSGQWFNHVFFSGFVTFKWNLGPPGKRKKLHRLLCRFPSISPWPAFFFGYGQKKPCSDAIFDIPPVKNP